MSWTVRNQIPFGTRFFARPDRPWGPTSLLQNGYRVLPWGKVRPGLAADHSQLSSAAVMKEYSYNSTHPVGHTGPVTGSFYIKIKCIRLTSDGSLTMTFRKIQVFKELTHYLSVNISRNFDVF